MSEGLPADGRYGPAPPERRPLEVVERREVGPYVVISVEDPGGPAPAPGQFYMLALAERWGGGADERPFLPRAISVMDAPAGRLEFMLENVGPGSGELCSAQPGERLMVLGPLGRGFRPAPGREPVVCAGGIGIAPMVMLARALGPDTPAALGFRDRPHAEASFLVPDARVATDDGSVGHEGNAVELLAGILDEFPEAEVYACGPPGMLGAVRELCLERGAGSQLALESGMACGFGACYGCVIPMAAGGYSRLCVDGPVLDGSLLDDEWQVAYG